MSESLAIEGWPVPLDVPGLRISLSTYRDAEVQVINGAVQIELKNYSGVIFLTPKECAADSVSASPASVRNSLAQEATPTKPALAGKGLRGLDCASAARTVRKPGVFLASADDDETQMDDTLGNKSPASSQQADTLSAFDTVHVDADEEGCDEEEDEEDEVPECVADLLRAVADAPHGELRIEAGDAPEKGIFHRIGAGKNPAKLGAVEVSASGVDGWSKPPDALAAGRKGGDGCRATPASAEEHGADAGARFFGFRLHRALELRLEGYALRNGSKDLGTFPQEWVVERRVGGFWEAVAVENTDALDGTKQAMKLFAVDRPGGFASDFRIRAVKDGPGEERRPHWFAAVELFGVLRASDAAPLARGAPGRGAPAGRAARSLSPEPAGAAGSAAGQRSPTLLSAKRPAPAEAARAAGKAPRAGGGAGQGIASFFRSVPA